jgi:spore maturation protein CgeB
VAKALEKKAQVDRYHLKSLDQEAFTRKRYDLVLATCPTRFPPAFWAAQEGTTVAHYFDLIVGWQGREKLYFPPLAEFDLVLGTDCMNPAYKAAGINARWFLQAVDPDEYYPVHGSIERDVAFIGHAYDGKRKRLVRELSERYAFGHFGSNNLCRGEAHAKVCASSRIMVADNAVNNLEGYWSNRAYLHLACAAFVMHPRVPGMESVFADGVHLCYYDSRDDLYDKIDHYLQRDDERDRIAHAGYELVRREHTWTTRMEEFWRILRESGLSPIPT